MGRASAHKLPAGDKEPNGRTYYYGAALAATAVLALPLAEASVKVRTGGPADEPGDLDLDVWAGVLPATVTFGAPVPDPALRPDLTVPAHIRSFPATRTATDA